MKVYPMTFLNQSWVVRTVKEDSWSRHFYSVQNAKSREPAYSLTISWNKI